MKSNEIFLIILLLFTHYNTIISFKLRKVDENGDYHDTKIITDDLKVKKAKNNVSLVSIQSKQAAVSKFTHFTVDLTRKSTEYSGMVKIGNPPQEFEMVFDTGSANFIVTSSKCDSLGCNNKRKYMSESSSTSKAVMSLQTYSEDYVKNMPGQRDGVFIRFGTGNVKCQITEDSVCVGKVDGFCVNKLLILEALEESEIPFTNLSFDGIIGLSFSHLSVSKQSNFIDMLVEENKISQRIFSFYFNKDDSKNSELHIGGISSKKFNGKILFADVISKNYWEIKLDSIWYGNIKLDYCQSVVCTAVVDTGTSMLAFPTLIIKSLLSLTRVTNDCSNIKLLENLKFEINGFFFNLEPKYYVMRITDEFISQPNNTNSNNLLLPNEVRCINAYMTLNALSKTDTMTIILGTPFFKKYYTVFDRERSRIGFAVSNHN